MCHLYVMSDRGAETCNGHSWQGQGGDWPHDQSGVRVGGVKVGADDGCDADRRRFMPRLHTVSRECETISLLIS